MHPACRALDILATETSVDGRAPLSREHRNVGVIGLAFVDGHRNMPDERRALDREPQR
jgi:hypothetical protein